MNSQKRTGKRSGEVVENTWLWKKRTGTNLRTNLPILLKINDSQKTAAMIRATLNHEFDAGHLPRLNLPADRAQPEM